LSYATYLIWALQGLIKNPGPHPEIFWITSTKTKTGSKTTIHIFHLVLGR